MQNRTRSSIPIISDSSIDCLTDHRLRICKKYWHYAKQEFQISLMQNRQVLRRIMRTIILLYSVRRIACTRGRPKTRIFQDQSGYWTRRYPGPVICYVTTNNPLRYFRFPGRLVTTTTNGASRDDSGVADDAKFLVVVPSAVVDFSISEVWTVGQVDVWIYQLLTDLLSS